MMAAAAAVPVTKILAGIRLHSLPVSEQVAFQENVPGRPVPAADIVSTIAFDCLC